MDGNTNCAPDYENLKILQKNRLETRSYFIPAANLEECRKAGNCENRELSSRMKLLSGTWDFQYYPSVYDVPDNIQKTFGKLSDTIDVPSCWQSRGYGKNIYLNIRYPIPALAPKVPNDNPTGVYQKSFYLTNNQASKRVILTFCGVSAAFHVYCNGKEVGYSQGSHNMSEFDITAFCREGINQLCVIVYQYCDGTYLESQDFFRNSGIFRDVYLIFCENDCIWNFNFEATPLNNKLNDFEIKLSLDLIGKDSEAKAILEFENKEIIISKIKNGTNFINIKNPELWTAETPRIYKLYIILEKDGREIEAVSHTVGFRHIEIKNGVFYFNNRAIKIRGINRHDFDPFNGHTVTLGQMKEDILLLKRFNNNCIRASHYPNDPRFPELCDRYGIYLVDEADIETHGATWMEKTPGDWKSNWSIFSESPEWEEAYLDRVKRMVERDRNHPCVIMWSLGNESGFLRNQKICYKWIKKSGTVIPVHYEGAIYHPCKGFDVVSMMYPDFKVMKEHLDNKDEPPFFMCEYTHGHGPCPSGLEEYWKLIYGSEKAMGGCVWQMCDHSAAVYGNDGSIVYRYGYGGDFNEGINDGIRCANGFFDPERNPRVAAYRMKQVYRPVRAELKTGKPFEIVFHNKMDFTDTSDILFSYELLENGICVESGSLQVEILPPHGTASVIFCPTTEIIGGREYFLNLYYRSAKSTEWFTENYELGFEQFAITEFHEYQPQIKSVDDIFAKESGNDVIVGVGNNEICFDKRRGGIKSITVSGHPFILPFKSTDMPVGKMQCCHGPRLNFWRPYIVGDEDSTEQWSRYGYDNAEIHIEKVETEINSENVIFKTECVYGAKGILPVFKSFITYTVSKDGLLKIDCRVIPLQKNMPSLKRMGIIFELCRDFDRVEYYGSGKWETYPDAQEGTKIGFYTQKISDLSEIDILPQEMGNHMNVRYCRFCSENHSLTVYSNRPFNMSAHHFTLEQIDAARHQEDLKEQRMTQICVDNFMAPIGQFLCGFPQEEKPFDLYPEDEMKFELFIELK